MMEAVEYAFLIGVGPLEAARYLFVFKQDLASWYLLFRSVLIAPRKVTIVSFLAFASSSNDLT